MLNDNHLAYKKRTYLKLIYIRTCGKAPLDELLPIGRSEGVSSS